jgi:murein DD-endopeptidase MepM/ murein hydrolase activator NlpD
MRHVLLAVLVILSPLVSAIASVALPTERAVPGGIAFVAVGRVDDPQPVVEHEGHRVAVVADGATWLAVVGLPLSLSAGRDAVTVRQGSQVRTAAFAVAERRYPTQSLKVAPKHVDLSKADLARFNEEKSRLDRILDGWTADTPASFQLTGPVDGIRSSTFGSRRVFNGAARNPHTGMDIAASTGMPVRSAGAGRVVDTYDYFFNGNTVIVDHGMGFFTLYCHLSRVDVHTGDRVDTGTRLGLVGATGRVTGPHLHFGVLLNRAWVDPELLLNSLKTESPPT